MRGGVHGTGAHPPCTDPEILAASSPRLFCRDTDVGELSLHTALRGADQLIRWAKFTMNPSGPRTDAMRQMPSYWPTPPTRW